jgi:hypothetical protein
MARTTTHRAEVYANYTTGNFDMSCPCGWNVKNVKNAAGLPASYEKVRAEADHHSRIAHSPYNR